LAVILMLGQYPLEVLSQDLLKVQPEQKALVAEYFYARIWAAPAALGLYALMGWFFGMQNAIYPLILTVGINAVNMLVSYLLVYHAGWDIAGVAWGTVIAQYFGLLLAIVLLLYKYPWVRETMSQAAVLQWKGLKRFLTINGDIFLRTFCLTFTFAYFYRQSSVEGDLILATNAILLQYINWMSYGVDGFAFAAESLVGKYYGAKNIKKTQKAIRLSFIWGMTLALLFAVIYGLMGKELLYIFTDQEEIVAAAVPFLGWMVAFPLLSTPCYIWDGIYIGLTASKAMRNSMALAFVAYLVFYFTLGQHLGNHGIWMSLLSFMIFRGLAQWWWYWGGKVVKW